MGGGWDWGYGYGGYGPEQQGTNVTVVMPQQPAPQVVINHNYVPETGSASSSVRVYEAPALGGGTGEGTIEKAETATSPAPKVAVEDKPTIYLIALTDSTVRAAIGYWTEAGALHYVTPQGHINHVSMVMLDRPTTDQLNRERGLEFELRD
jgi:hypothetical protein